jgi:hypothetical protein
MGHLLSGSPHVWFWLRLILSKNGRGRRLLHKDPLDRILVAPSMVESITLLIADPMVAQKAGTRRKAPCNGQPRTLVPVNGGAEYSPAVPGP